MAKYSQVEYVYNLGKDFEFHKVLVEIYVEETQVMLKIIPDNMMTTEELDIMLRGFQTEVLAQRRISIEADCAVEVAFDGKTYGVELYNAKNRPLVKRIITE